jgi:hypothetical protein
MPAATPAGPREQPNSGASTALDRTAAEGTGNGGPPSRRAVLLAGLMAGAGAAGLPLLTLVRDGTPVADIEPSSGTSSSAVGSAGAAPSGTWAAGAGTSSGGLAFNTGWLFGGEYSPGTERASYDDSAFTPVTLPHTVTPLSWGNWDPSSWQKVWIYRRHFDGTSLSAGRVFADFDGVMVDAVAVLNDHVAGSHTGGYLPCRSS